MVCLEGLRLANEYGLCREYSAPIFALLGLIFAGVLEDFKWAAIFCDLALTTLEETSSRNVESKVNFVNSWFVMHWVKPCEDIKKPLLKSYQMGMATGDCESASWGIFCYLEVSLMRGSDTSGVIKDCQQYGSCLRGAGHENIRNYISMTHQMALNLRGEVTAPEVSSAKRSMSAKFVRWPRKQKTSTCCS